MEEKRLKIKEMSKEKFDLAFPNIANENFEKLATFFPNCTTESTDMAKTNIRQLLKQLSPETEMKVI